MTFYINFGKKLEFTTSKAFLVGQALAPPGFATGFYHIFLKKKHVFFYLKVLL